MDRWGGEGVCLQGAEPLGGCVTDAARPGRGHQQQLAVGRGRGRDEAGRDEAVKCGG